MRNVARTLVLIMVCSAMLSAESAKSLHKKGVQAEARQDYEAAYDYYKQAYDQEPTNLKYRVPFERMRFLAAAAKVHRGQRLREQGKLQDALILFQQAAAIDPSNDRAAQEVRRTQQMMQKSQEKGPKAKEEEEDPLRRRLEQAAAPVQLGPISNIPLPALQYSEDSKIIYETIGKLAKINVLFDPDYQSRHLSISLQNVTLGEALDIVALESRTFWRPVTPNTIFVAADTQAKRRELEQNVIKTFYLGNVSGPTDIQDIVNAIRTVLEVQRIQQIPSQNAIVIKATPDQLAMAEKMIDDIDKSKPEVVVDVIVAQVRRDKLRNLGILPPQNATVALQGTNTTTTSSTGGTSTGGTTTSTGGGLNFNDLQHLNSTNYAVTIDPVKAIALFNDTDTKIIQSPRIRASDNEKATLKIADKIPIATGSFGTPLGVGTAVGAVGVNTQFAYQDVGVIMEIQPRVHPEGQVTLKTKMEISNLNGQSTIGGISQPIISQRSVEHTIRLNDGEINLLGGILEQQLTKTNSGTPFLGQIPLLKYIFSQEQKEVVTNEIVFLLIPHIVRGQELNDLNRRAFDVGTGSGIDLHIAQRQLQNAPVSASVQQESATANPAPAYQPPAQPAAQPRPQPVAPPVQPAAAQPSTAPATNAAPANAVPTKPSPATGQTGLQFNPAMVSPTAGSQFALDVVMAHGQDIAAVPIQISYDPKVVEFVSVTNGDFLARDGQAVTLVHRDDPAAGKLQITAQRPPGSSGVSGDGIVFRLTFTAKAKGQGVVAIAIPGARNSQNQPIDILGAQAAVNVN